MDIKKLKTVVAVLLIIGIAPFPYFYYQLLRLIVTITGGYFGYEYFKQDKMNWALAYAIIALIFNPVFPIYLNKGIWVIIDGICGILVGFDVIKNYEKV